MIYNQSEGSINKVITIIHIIFKIVVKLSLKIYI